MDMNLECWIQEGIWIPDGVPTFDWEDYKCVEQLGRSGVGYSYKVQHVSTGEFFAIKKVLISSDEVNDDSLKERIMNDMTLTTSLDHPNIMKCLGLCVNKFGIHFLYNWMPQNLSAKTIQDQSLLAQIAYQVLNGLIYLRNEKNLVFKHITPANLLFDPSCSLVKIADVGTIKDKHILSGYIRHDLRYMKYISPENYHIDSYHEDANCVLHSDRYTKSDAWSLGLSLLELYNGKFPFVGDNRALMTILLYGFNFEYGKSGVCETDVWPPRPPHDAPAHFRDFVSSCLKLDETQRLGVDDLLKHDFITTHCALVSEQGHSSDHTKISDESIYEYDHLEFPTSSEHDGNIEHHKKKLRLSAETST